MTAQEYLSKAYRLDNHIELELRQIEQLRSMVCSLQSVSDSAPVQHSASNDAPFTKTIDKLVDKEREVDVLIDSLVQTKLNIEALINVIEDEDTRLILRFKYCSGLSFRAIAEKLFLSKTTVQRLHDDALMQIEKSDLFQKMGQNGTDWHS